MIKKKKLLFIILASCLALASIGILIFALCDKPKKNNDLNLDKMYISNYSSYQAIGVGNSKTTTSSSLKRVYASDGHSHKNHKLIGVKEDNSVEELTFVESPEETDSAKQIELWKPCNFVAFNNFSFVSLTYNPTSYDFNRSTFTVVSDEYDDDYKSFIIDNQTGKIYDLNKIVPNEYSSVSLFGPSDFSYYNYNQFESDNAIYFNISYSSHATNSYDYSIKKFSIENGELKVEDVVNNSLISFHRDFIVDKYNNLYLSHKPNDDYWGYGQTDNYDYIYTSNKELKSLDNLTLYKGLNGIVYTTINDQTMKFDENGNLVVSTDTAENIFLSKHTLVKKVDNVEYHYAISSNITDETIISTPSKEYIYKLTWIDSINYTVEKISIGFNYDNTMQHANTNDKIYFLSITSIFYLDIATGSRTNLNSEYFFNSISTDYLGNIIFTATNSQLQSVNGLIKNDGTIDISISETKFTVLYISSIN